MCGFFSFIGDFRIDEATLQKSIKDIIHRGPDNQKFITFKIIISIL